MGFILPDLWTFELLPEILSVNQQRENRLLCSDLPDLV